VKLETNITKIRIGNGIRNEKQWLYEKSPSGFFPEWNWKKSSFDSVLAHSTLPNKIDSILYFFPFLR
jgi:hypothetical protein